MITATDARRIVGILNADAARCAKLSDQASEERLADALQIRAERSQEMAAKMSAIAEGIARMNARWSVLAPRFQDGDNV